MQILDLPSLSHSPNFKPDITSLPLRHEVSKPDRPIKNSVESFQDSLKDHIVPTRRKLTESKMKILGVLAIQGAYTQHIQHFNKVIEKLNITDLKVIKVSSDEHLQQCDALVIPGKLSS